MAEPTRPHVAQAHPWSIPHFLPWNSSRPLSLTWPSGLDICIFFVLNSLSLGSGLAGAQDNLILAVLYVGKKNLLCITQTQAGTCAHCPLEKALWTSLPNLLMFCGGVVCWRR